ncbi:hypothetical protein [Sphingobium sp. B11D3A]|uniref:hypothetical protein n=1 Tax=Sphingobium sp. B11D3A TaxID=2940574 RepID=UPI002225B04A|nr:hypothetical protein [Sphingobium sp. B11D3A]MCW2393553.1 hypothetical protein [Sphingobium sp. B11D3A]
MPDFLTLSPFVEADSRTYSFQPRETSRHSRQARWRWSAIGDHWRAAALLGFALGYATLRYNVLKGVPWADWPAYTVNKALAVGSLILMVAAVFRLRQPARSGTPFLIWAGALALTHSLLSFPLLNPIYYPRLFESGKLTGIAGLSLTLGALLMAGLELGARRAGVWSYGLRVRALTLIAFGTGVHAALPAVSTWFEPAKWPGGLPPLTLISFLAGALTLGIWLYQGLSRSASR